jgi:hypothetical protein
MGGTYHGAFILNCIICIFSVHELQFRINQNVYSTEGMLGYNGPGHRAMRQGSGLGQVPETKHDFSEPRCYREPPRI